MYGRDVREWASKSKICGVSQANENGNENQPRQQLEGRPGDDRCYPAHCRDLLSSARRSEKIDGIRLGNGVGAKAYVMTSKVLVDSEVF